MKATNPNRKPFHDQHMKHAKRWGYIPMSWHKWKFVYWPSLPEGLSKNDIITDAADYSVFGFVNVRG